MASVSVLVQFGLHNPYCLAQSGLCNPETSFPTPFVDFQQGDLHISDYIIQSLYKISGLCNLKPSIQKWHQHPSGWLKCKNPRICTEFKFQKLFGFYIPNQEYFWKKQDARGKPQGGKSKSYDKIVILNTVYLL